MKADTKSAYGALGVVEIEEIRPFGHNVVKSNARAPARTHLHGVNYPSRPKGGTEALRKCGVERSSDMSSSCTGKLDQLSDLTWQQYRMDLSPYGRHTRSREGSCTRTVIVPRLDRPKQQRVIERSIAGLWSLAHTVMRLSAEAGNRWSKRRPTRGSGAFSLKAVGTSKGHGLSEVSAESSAPDSI